MAPPAQTPSGTMAAIIISIKLAAVGIAIAVTTLLIYRSGFRWYAAVAVGVLAYIAAKVVVSIGVGHIWGRQDARELKQFIANLPPDVSQDIINNAPSDVKERVAKMVAVSRRQA
jgi:hypothetical protein